MFGPALRAFRARGRYRVAPETARAAARAANFDFDAAPAAKQDFFLADFLIAQAAEEGGSPLLLQRC
eukprot:3079799-Lingulodinium_polyedra.AAC.1